MVKSLQKTIWLLLKKLNRGFPDGSAVRTYLQCRRLGKRCEYDLWVGKIPWRKEWLPTPVFLPRESHGQRSLVGYSPRGHKASDMIEQSTQPAQQ